MVYRAIGVMSGSSLDGLDIVFAEFHDQAGQWSFEILEADCLPYESLWTERLKNAINLPALDYQLLHIEYGHYLGKAINRFIEQNQLQYKVALVASHGHTTFHVPARQMTAQLGDGASIAAETGLPVVSDLRSMDLAFGGQGAPIVPIGEKLLLGSYQFFLNIGGIANISFNTEPYTAYDICPANRVLNLLAAELGKSYDENGDLAASGKTDQQLLEKLNALDYYQQAPPKSLANDFGTDIVYPLIKTAGINIKDALCTYTEHIAEQVATAAKRSGPATGKSSLLVTGGGAFNSYLVNKMQEKLAGSGIEIVVPDAKLVNYKEALIMALIGVLRWRQEYNVLASVTGAKRNSIGGALWTGEEA